MSREQLFHGKRVFLAGGKTLEDGVVVVRGDVIAAVTLLRALSAQERSAVVSCDLLCPGMVDIHNHGVGGTQQVCDYWTTDYSARQLPAGGTTSVLASIVFPPSGFDATCAAAEQLVERTFARRPADSKLARVVGLHAEGPIVATCGGLPKVCVSYAARSCVERAGISSSLWLTWCCAGREREAAAAVRQRL